MSGKINFRQNLFECATRDLLEEAGLHATECTLCAIEQVKTYENGKLLHHYLFHISTNKVSGNLKEKTYKAEHAWLTLDEYHQKEIFPSEKFFIHIIPGKRPLLIEAERYMENGKFTEYKTLSVKEL